MWGWVSSSNAIVERKIKTLTLESRTLHLYAKIYWPEEITTMLWPYSLKVFAEQLNVLKVDDNEITPMEKFSGTTTDIYLKNSHTWGFPVCFLDAILKVNIYGISNWEPRSRAVVYLGHSPFHAGLVSLILNPETGYVSPQFYVVFDDEFSTVPFMREGIITQIGHILCNAAPKILHQRILDSRILFHSK